MWSTSLDCYQNYVLSPLNTHIHRYNYTHIHRYIHMLYSRGYAHTNKHTYIYIHITQIYTHIYTGTDKYIHTNTHACKQTYMYINAAYTHTVCMYVRTCFRILYQLMMREPIAIHFNWFTIKLVPNNKLKIWVCILWIFDRLQIREKQ